MVVAAAVTSPALSQALPGTEPVPASQLRGTRLVGLDSSFTVDAPSPDWQWLRPKPQMLKSATRPDIEPQIYILYDAIQRRSFLFEVLHFSNHKSAPDEEFMRGYQNGVERTSSQTGLTIHEFHFAPADIPVKGRSYRYKAKAMRTDGAVRYLYGYVGGSEKKFVFGYIDTAEQEAPEFSTFARSFIIEPAK
jgi:hypothetical protein